MANVSDKITDVRNAARPVSARVITSRNTGGTSLACDSLVGWPTASKVHFVTYQIDTNSNPVGGTQLDCYGIVSASTITQLAVVDGTDVGNSVGDVVEMLPTAAWGQDLADALTVGHARTGAHVSSLPLTSPVLTTPVITDYTSANHTHATTAQGGTLPATAVPALSLASQTLSNPYKFYAYRSTAWTLGNNSYAKVALNSELFDTNSNFDSVTNNRYVAPVAGFYHFSGNVVSSAVGDALYAVAIYKNGSIAASGGGNVPSVPSSLSQPVSVLLQLAATDYIELFAYGTGNAGGTVATDVFLTGFLVSTT